MEEGSQPEGESTVKPNKNGIDSWRVENWVEKGEARPSHEHQERIDSNSKSKGKQTEVVPLDLSSNLAYSESIDIGKIESCNNNSFKSMTQGASIRHQNEHSFSSTLSKPVQTQDRQTAGKLQEGETAERTNNVQSSTTDHDAMNKISNQEEVLVLKNKDINNQNQKGRNEDGPNIGNQFISVKDEPMASIAQEIPREEKKENFSFRSLPEGISSFVRELQINNSSGLSEKNSNIHQNRIYPKETIEERKSPIEPELFQKDLQVIRERIQQSQEISKSAGTPDRQENLNKEANLLELSMSDVNSLDDIQSRIESSQKNKKSLVFLLQLKNGLNKGYQDQKNQDAFLQMKSKDFPSGHYSRSSQGSQNSHERSEKILPTSFSILHSEETQQGPINLPQNNTSSQIAIQPNSQESSQYRPFNFNSSQ